MPKIFISYRRQDSQDITMRIRERLAMHYGDDSVFIDIDSVPLGTDFVEQIGHAIAKCDALIAIVGPHWMRTDRQPGGTDYVRIEIEAALTRNIAIIPVLVGGAIMPNPAELPETLRRFTFRNGAAVDSGVNFRNDTDRLLRALDQHFGPQSTTTARPLGPTDGNPTTLRLQSDARKRNYSLVAMVTNVWHAILSPTGSKLVSGSVILVVAGFAIIAMYVSKQQNVPQLEQRHTSQSEREKPERTKSELLVTPLGGERIRPLDGFPILERSTYAEGARISLGLSHNLGHQPIIIRRITPIIRYTAGSDPKLSYKVSSAAIGGAGVTEPRRFIIRLYGPQDPTVTWITETGRREVARADNMLAVDPPKHIRLDRADSAEELDITVSAMEAGSYEITFEIGYTIDAADQQFETEPIRIYRR